MSGRVDYAAAWRDPLPRVDRSSDDRWKNRPERLVKTAPATGVKCKPACIREMVPRGGLQESRIIKGLARGGTLKLLPAFFSFPHHGVPPKRLTNKLYERLQL
jgi:hypothetical protein